MALCRGHQDLHPFPEDFALRYAWEKEHTSLEDAASHRTGLPRHDWSLLREGADEALSTRVSAQYG